MPKKKNVLKNVLKNLNYEGKPEYDKGTRSEEKQMQDAINASLSQVPAAPVPALVQAAPVPVPAPVQVAPAPAPLSNAFDLPMMTSDLPSFSGGEQQKSTAYIRMRDPKNQKHRSINPAHNKKIQVQIVDVRRNIAKDQENAQIEMKDTDTNIQSKMKEAEDTNLQLHQMLIQLQNQKDTKQNEQIVQFENEIIQLKNQLRDALQAVENKSNEIKSIIAANNQQNDVLKNEYIRRIEQEKKQIENELILQFNKEKTILEAEIKTVNEKLIQASEELKENIQGRNENYDIAMNNYQLLAEERKTSDILKQQLNIKNDELTHIQQLINQKDQQLMVHQTEAENLQKRIQQLEAQERKMDSTVDASELAKIQKEKDDLQALYMQVLTALKDDQLIIQNLTQQYNIDRQNYIAERQNLQQLIQGGQGHILQLQQQLAAVQDRSDKVITNLQQQLATAQQQGNQANIIQLQQQLAAVQQKADNDIRNLQQQLIAQQQQSENRIQQIGQREASILGKLQQAEGQIRQHEQTIDDYKILIQRANRKENINQDEIQRLQNAEQQARNDLVLAQQDLATIRERLQRQQQQQPIANQEIQQLQQNLQQINRRIDTLIDQGQNNNNIAGQLAQLIAAKDQLRKILVHVLRNSALNRLDMAQPRMAAVVTAPFTGYPEIQTTRRKYKMNQNILQDYYLKI